MLGWPERLRAGQGEEALKLAKESLDACIARGLPFRPADGRRLFDGVEVHNFINSRYADGVPLATTSLERERSMVQAGVATSRVELMVRRVISVDDRAPVPGKGHARAA